MFGSTVLEVAVGLTFCYATVALIVSTVQEALASALRMRAGMLIGAVRGMLGDPSFGGLARAVYAHALVNPHDEAHANPHALGSKPAYIEPRNFAIALLDSVQSIPGDFAQLGRDIDSLQDTAVKRALQGFYQRAEGDAIRFEAAVTAWFNSAMERVSGAYKRRSMIISLLLSFLLAALFNIDSIHLFRSLWQHPALAAHISAAPSGVDQQTLDALMTLPVGWHSFPPKFDGGFALSVAGWLLTASTALFGAPFWFDLMKRTMRVRGDDPKH
jgi:hypothetical protein